MSSETGAEACIAGTSDEALLMKDPQAHVTFFARFLWLRGYTAILRQLKLLTANAFRVHVENGLEYIFFLHFSPISIQV